MQGRTVLFVSHNMESIIGLCERVIWLNQGQIEADGEPQAMVEQYSAAMLKAVGAADLLNRQDRMGSGEIRFSGFSMRDANDKPIMQPATGQPVKFVVEYRGFEHPRNLEAAIIVMDSSATQARHRIQYDRRRTPKRPGDWRTRLLCASLAAQTGGIYIEYALIFAGHCD